VAPLLAGVKALLVEDHEDTRLMYSEALASLGAEVVAVSTATEGLEKLAELRPHVVISDIGLPDDPYTLSQKAKASGVPAIALTGRNVRQRALDDGYCLFLMKPVDPFTLGEEIARLVRPG
jgi:CheY-like chemotaxis protein